MRKFFLFIATLCCASMFSAAQFDGLKSIESGGKTRQYYLYVPTNLEPNSPLMISCHGMDQDYYYQNSLTQWPLLADTASFVVVYPVGVAGKAWGMNYSTGWDVEGMTDVNFMLDIIDDVKADYDIDDTRVYLSGFSLGGAFVYHAINKAADKFAAFAPISGYNLMTNNTTAGRYVPIIHVHGTADNVMPYSGIQNYIKLWAQAELCNMNPEETSGDGYTCQHYRDCSDATEIVLYSVTGRGHEPTNEGFHTSKAIWNFCKEYTTIGKLDIVDVFLSVETLSERVPASVKLTATPFLPKGVSVSSMEFYQGDKLIKTLTSEPYEVIVENLKAGSYLFTATMTDSKGSSHSKSKIYEVKGTHTSALKTIQSGGVERQYFIYVPDGLEPNSPLFIACHGMDQSYQYHKENVMAWLYELGDKEGFVTVFPVGLPGNSGGKNYSTGWDIEGMTDVNFMIDIINDVKADYNIDDTRVYMTGFSMGAIFSYHMANKAADKVAAIVPFSGYDVLDRSVTASRPVPVFHWHGTTDNTLSYAGVESHLKQWRDFANCPSQPVVEKNKPLSFSAGARLDTYGPCDCGIDIQLLTAPNVDHNWTDGNHSYEVGKYVWDFCKQYNTGCGKIVIDVEKVDSQKSKVQSQKVLENGQLYLKYNGATYTVQGVRVK